MEREQARAAAVEGWRSVFEAKLGCLRQIISTDLGQHGEREVYTRGDAAACDDVAIPRHT
jgi:hypothetical protein